MIIQNRTISVALICSQGQKNTQNLNITNSIEVTIIGVARGGEAGDPGPPNQNATNDKNVTKKFCFFIFSFF